MIMMSWIKQLEPILLVAGTNKRLKAVQTYSMRQSKAQSNLGIRCSIGSVDDFRTKRYVGRTTETQRGHHGTKTYQKIQPSIMHELVQLRSAF